MMAKVLGIFKSFYAGNTFGFKVEEMSQLYYLETERYRLFSRLLYSGKLSAKLNHIQL